MWLFSMLAIHCAHADLPRITASVHDSSKVDKIYLSAGLISLLEFPQNIIEVRNGNPQSLKAVISQSSPKELTLYLQSGASSPTNLIVRADRRVYVFDIFPSKTKHQDYVLIRGTYGMPQMAPVNVSERINLTPAEPLKAQPQKSKTVRVSL